MIPWLAAGTPFPPLEQALREPNGLLCAGGELSPQRLIDAYQQGIFPWYARGEPILWWSPDPRMVLFPGEFRISRSLRRALRSGRFEVTLDSDFPAVIRACAEAPRAGQHGTWITREMQRAYWKLFQNGIAHSVETRIDGTLVGGLYGLAIGRMFYGESMFSMAADASKVAAAHLARFLEEEALRPDRLPDEHPASGFSGGAGDSARRFHGSLARAGGASVAARPMADRGCPPTLDLAECRDSTTQSCLSRCYSSMRRRLTPAATWRISGRVRRSPRPAI
jgi:leucyl/phenylalanyl-tRNA--protein transferase